MAQSLTRLGAPNRSSLAYEILVARYSEPQRAYHTLQHIENCLKEFEDVRHLANDPDAIELAIEAEMDKKMTNPVLKIFFVAAIFLN